MLPRLLAGLESERTISSHRRRSSASRLGGRFVFVQELVDGLAGHGAQGQSVGPVPPTPERRVRSQTGSLTTDRDGPVMHCYGFRRLDPARDPLRTGPRPINVTIRSLANAETRI
jgi:hypothetical protein